jgi:tripartite-type tricarboxylate transporter receptor subunit TctC
MLTTPSSQLATACVQRFGLLVRFLGFAFALLFLAGPLWAAGPYPSRTIRWVVPWPAGGVADTQARVIAELLGKALGQQVVVDNRAGATGTLGADLVAKAKPDGYTLLYVSPNEQAIVQAAGMKVNYTAEKDFAPITQFLRRPAVLVADPSLNARTVGELVALVKAKGESVSYGTRASRTSVTSSLKCSIAESASRSLQCPIKAKRR